MGKIDIVNLALGVAGLLTILFYRTRVAAALIEALDNFRGGPPPPMHPSPSNDSPLLIRKRRRQES